MLYILVTSKSPVYGFYASSDTEAEKLGMPMIPPGEYMLYIARVVAN